MRFVETLLDGAWTIELDPLGDERGWFARTFDATDFLARGLEPAVAQCNLSFNRRAGTLRGLHYQEQPHGEAKLVRCVHGAIFDVAVDMRSDSPTFRRWHAVELSAENRLALYIPVGMAHGFQTLTDGCEVLYQMSSPYVSQSARGVRWDDPAFAIEWPPAPGGRIISERDRGYPDFDRGQHR